MNKPFLLLVDDSGEMADLVRWQCKRSGIELAHCLDVDAGKLALQERTPDLLLLDLRLGSQHGTVLARWVRATPRLAGLRIALFTNLELWEDIHGGLAAGADLVFAKDLVVEREQCEQRLREILAWSRGRVWQKLVALNEDLAWTTPPRNSLAAYNKALHQALARRMGTVEVLGLLLQRAVAETIAHGKHTDDPLTWLCADGIGLNVEQIEASAGPETVAFLGAALAEHMWCLLGSRNSVFFTTVLDHVVPGLTRALSF